MIRLCVCVALSALCLTGTGMAQDAAQGEAKSQLGGYDALNIEAGVAEFTFDGRIDSLTGGAKVTLISDDPAKQPLPISANKITFTPSEKDPKKPSKIVLDQKVVVTHPQGTVRADKAEWDLEAGILTFTGSPVMSTPKAKEIRADKMILDFNGNHIRGEGMRIQEWRMGEGIGGGEAADPSLLGEKDVKDWAGFLDKVRTQAGAKEASPGKQIVSLLDSKVQNLIKTLPTEQLVENKESILKQINKVLQNPKLYDEAAWNGIEIPAAAKDLMATKPTGPDQIRLNRLLLEAAYPGVIGAVGAAPQQ